MRREVLDRPEALVLPGGRVEPGEEPHEAATRELREETGLELLGYRFAFHAAGTVPGWQVTVFRAIAWCGTLVQREPGIVPQWVHPSALVDPARSPFAEFYRRLYASLGWDLRP